MKSNKVLLGLFVGVLTLMGGTVSAQTDENFFEMGPSNVGGKVTSIIIDQRDTTHNTIYAGAASGGLFVRSTDVDYLRSYYATRGITDSVIYSNQQTWHLVPFMKDGHQEVLPINCMIQGPDNTIFIGTGDDAYQVGSTYSPMSSLGKGLYRYNPANYTFTLVPGTAPTSLASNFAAINKLDYIVRDGKCYFFAVTGNGIYRWTIASESDWSNAPQKVFDGKVLDFTITRELNMAFFSVGNQLYKIGDLTVATPQCINISNTNTAFGGDNTAIRLTSTYNDGSYLYAMVFDSVGRMEGIYLTTNQQTWTALTTSTVVPFTTNVGTTAGTMFVDPENPKRIYVGGSSLWTGEGYLDNGYFQWTKSSYNESELNTGDYMGSVFNSFFFVHSGIHQIVASYLTVDEEPYYVFYFATDGGIYTSAKEAGPSSDLSAFTPLNIGLNNVQINSVAVSPDGTIVSGANSNSVPLIESRMAHHGGDITPTWYDNGSLGNTNHDANIIWTGNGGTVAASRFQQVTPLSRRTVYVSSNNGGLGRSYADYMDYTNTQTWTAGSDFASDEIANGPEIGKIYLWETDNNTLFNDYGTYVIDTLGYIMRGADTVWIEPQRDGNEVTRWRGDFPLQSGDKITLLDKAHAEYPFVYTVPRAMTAKEHISVINPLQSRLLAVGQQNGNSTNKWGVFLSWRASDFSKVWNQEEYEAGRTDASKYERLNLWAPVLVLTTTSTSERNLYPRTMAMSGDGRYVYIAAQDLDNNRSILYRVGGFENVDFTAGAKEIQAAMTDPRVSTVSVLHIDTLVLNGDSWWLPRVVSSMFVDNNNGNERLVLTFEGYADDNTANVAYVNNITTDNYSLQTLPTIKNSDNANIPAFTAIVEKTTRNLYVGTTDGVFVYNNGAWSNYDHLRGIAVTSIAQQTCDYPVRHALGHTGINENQYVFSKTKWPNAIYFGTYGRGIFMDMTYVTDRENEISDPEDYNPPVDIPTVYDNGRTSVSVYPNPAVDKATLSINSEVSGIARLTIYDLNGRCVVNTMIGRIAEGESTYTVDCSTLPHGMYLVNVTVGTSTAATKLIVR